MADLSKYVYYACGSINYDTKSVDDVSTLISHLVEMSEDYNRITKYYFIAHTETDVLHIHFIFYIRNQCQLYTIFNKLRKCVVDKYRDTRNDEGINLMKCENFNSHMRYILHQDKKSILEGKKRYEVDDIISNDELDIIESIVKSVKGEIDAYYLRDVVLDSIDDFEMMNTLGLKTYHRYRYEIQIIRENLGYYREQRRNERNQVLQEDFINNCVDNQN